MTVENQQFLWWKDGKFMLAIVTVIVSVSMAMQSLRSDVDLNKNSIAEKPSRADIVQLQIEVNRLKEQEVKNEQMRIMVIKLVENVNSIKDDTKKIKEAIEKLSKEK